MNAFYTHVLQQHGEWHNQNRNPSLSRLWNGGVGIWPESCALAKTLLKTINICVTLALIFVYLTAQLKSNADGCLSQTYTSLGVFYFSTCCPQWNLETFSPANSAVLQAKDLIDTGKLTMPAVYPFCIHLSYLSDVNTRRFPCSFSTRCSVLALWL